MSDAERLLGEFSEVCYKAGLLHGQGLLGSQQHREALERSKVLFQELKKFINDNTPPEKAELPKP